MFSSLQFSDNTEAINIESSQFTKQLKNKWDKIHSESNIFRYKVNNSPERIIDNIYIVQLNTDRGTNRRTPEYIDNVCQPFDGNKFNFNKASPKEVLFKIQDSCSTDIHTFLVNVSPISRYHTLMCPSITRCLPQVVTEDSLKLALEVKFLAQDRDLKIGYNSLCAFASVNHLHYHLLFEKNTLYVETAQPIHIKGPLYIIKNTAVPAFCFKVTLESIPQATKNIYRLIYFLLSKSIAHNLLVANEEPECGESKVLRVLVTPRKSSAGVKQLTSFNVAVCELSGWFPVYNEEHFKNLDASVLENELAKWKLPNFEELCDEIQLLY